MYCLYYEAVSSNISKTVSLPVGVMKSVEREKKDVTVAIDGEPIRILSATFQVHSNALNLKM